MDPFITGTLISAGSNLLGGLFGKKQSSVKAYNQARELQNLQLEGMKQQIPAMVEGAKNAGLHPLLGVGVNPMQSAGPPVSVGGFDSSRGQMLSEMGQNIGRAVSAYQTPEQRAQVQTLASLQLERAALENDLLRSQITRINQPTTPALPSSNSSSLSPDVRPHVTPDGVPIIGPQGETLEMTSDMNPYGMAYMLRDIIGRTGRVGSSFRGLLKSLDTYHGKRSKIYQQRR